MSDFPGLERDLIIKRGFVFFGGGLALKGGTLIKLANLVLFLGNL